MIEKIDKKIEELIKEKDKVDTPEIKLFIIGKIDMLIWVKMLLIEDEKNKVI